jgi:hypothetical protein
MTAPIFRHPDHPRRLVLSYYAVISKAGSPIAIHLFEPGHESDALTAARHCSDRSAESHVAIDGRRVYESRPRKRDIRPGAWDGPVGTTVTVRGPGGCYVQEER